MSASLEQDLQALLQSSEEDRDSFERIRILREWLKASDPVATWPLEDRLARVRQKVMLAIVEDNELRSSRYEEAGKLETKDLSV